MRVANPPKRTRPSSADYSAMLTTLQGISNQIAAVSGTDPWQAATIAGTVTTASGSGIPANIIGAAQAITWLLNPTQIRLSRSARITQATNYVQCPTGMVLANTLNGCWTRAFFGRVSGSRYFAFRLLGSTTERSLIEVNGQFIDKAGHLPAGTGSQWFVVDMGAVGDYDIAIWNGSSNGIYGAYAGTGGTITAPSAPTYDYEAAILGDSITDGTGPDYTWYSWPAMAMWRLGFNRLTPNGVSGTDWNYRSGSGLNYSGLDRICNITLVNNNEMIAQGVQNMRVPDILICALGINALVSGITPTAQAAALTAGLDILQRDAPRLPIIVFGPYDRNAPAAPESGFSAINTAMQDVCTGRLGVVFKSLEGIAYAKADGTHPINTGSVELTTGIVPLITSGVSDLIAQLA